MPQLGIEHTSWVCALTRHDFHKNKSCLHMAIFKFVVTTTTSTNSTPTEPGDSLGGRYSMTNVRPPGAHSYHYSHCLAVTATWVQ